MPTYLWRCPGCGQRFEHDRAVKVYECVHCGTECYRDWKSEGANVNIANLKAAH